jgi:SAM-dependent methyltransferase
MQEHHQAASPPADPVSWVLANLEVRQTTSWQFLYDHMDSQSGRSLEIIYQPFRPADRGHFAGRGAILDFALHAGGGGVLDFGPGDGWPSLLMAPMVREVVGVEGSQRRVRVCEDNARRLGISNARFVYVEPGQPLPFSDATFDAAVAASSIEQTPDPRATLAELHRVLRPGGRLRMDAETLGYYRGGKERGLWLASDNGFETRLILCQRHIDEEYAVQYGVAVALDVDQVKAIFARHGQKVRYEGLTAEVLEALRKHVTDAGTWRTRHPSSATWIAWLKKAGFRSARPTQDGGSFAKALFDRLPESQRPRDLLATDEYLRPIVQTVISLPAPPGPRADGWEPMITAEK